MSKVQRMEKAKVTIMEPRAEEGGYHEVEIEKFLWKCLGCGQVWAARRDAQNCEGRNHASSYQRRYGVRYYNNGRPVGGYTVSFFPVRKEEVA